MSPKKWVLWSFCLYVVLLATLVAARLLLPDGLSQFIGQETASTYAINEFAKLVVLGLLVFASLKNSRLCAILLAICSLLFMLLGGFTSPILPIQILLIPLRIVNLSLIVAACALWVSLNKEASKPIGTQIVGGIGHSILMLGLFLMLLMLVGTFFCPQLSGAGMSGCADVGIVTVPLFLFGGLLVLVGGVVLGVRRLFRKN